LHCAICQKGGSAKATSCARGVKSEAGRGGEKKKSDEKRRSVPKGGDVTSQPSNRKRMGRLSMEFDAEKGSK